MPRAALTAAITAARALTIVETSTLQWEYGSRRNFRWLPLAADVFHLLDKHASSQNRKVPDWWAAELLELHWNVWLGIHLHICISRSPSTTLVAGMAWRLSKRTCRLILGAAPECSLVQWSDFRHLPQDQRTCLLSTTTASPDLLLRFTLHILTKRPQWTWSVWHAWIKDMLNHLKLLLWPKCYATKRTFPVGFITFAVLSSINAMVYLSRFPHDPRSHAMRAMAPARERKG